MKQISIPHPPTPTIVDETASWKIYQGDGFSFKYSPEYIQDENSTNRTRWSFEFTPGQKDGDQMFLLSQNSPFIEPKIGAIMYFYPPFNPNKTYNVESLGESKSINLDSKFAKLYILGCGADCQYESVYFENKGKYYRLEAFTAGGGLQQRFEQLLKTFKFTQ